MAPKIPQIIQQPEHLITNKKHNTYKESIEKEYDTNLIFSLLTFLYT